MSNMNSIPEIVKCPPIIKLVQFFYVAAYPIDALI